MAWQRGALWRALCSVCLSRKWRINNTKKAYQRFAHGAAQSAKSGIWHQHVRSGAHGVNNIKRSGIVAAAIISIFCWAWRIRKRRAA